MSRDFIKENFNDYNKLLENRSVLQRSIASQVLEIQKVRRDVSDEQESYSRIKAVTQSKCEENSHILDRMLPELWQGLKTELDLGYEGGDSKAAVHLKRLFALKSRAENLKKQQNYLKCVRNALKSIEEFDNVLKSDFRQAWKRNNPVLLLISAFHELQNAEKHLSAQFKQSNARLFVTEKIAEQFEQLQKLLFEQFGNALDALNWPVQPIKYTDLNLIASEQLNQWKLTFKLLGMVKYPVSVPSFEFKLSYGCPRAPRHSGHCHLGICRMVLALQKRFRFHFMTARPTNRLDKPEWFFSNVTKTIGDHFGLVEDVITPLVGEVSNETISFHSPIIQFVLLMLSSVFDKICADIPLLMASPAHMSHYLLEAAQFDRVMFQILPKWDAEKPETSVGVLLGEAGLLDKFVQHTLNDEVLRFVNYMDPEVAWEFVDISSGGFAQKSTAPYLHCVDAITTQVLLHFAQTYDSCGSVRLAKSLFSHVQLFLLQKFLQIAHLVLSLSESKIGRPWIRRRESEIQSLADSAPDSADTGDDALDFESDGKRPDGSLSVQVASLIAGLCKDYSKQFSALVTKYTMTGLLGRLCCALESMQQFMNESAEHDYYYNLSPNKRDGRLFGESAVSVFSATIEDYAKVQRRAELLLVHDLVRQVKNLWSEYTRKKAWPQLALAVDSSASKQPLSSVYSDASLRGLEISPELQQGLLVLSNCLEQTLVPLINKKSLRKSVLPLLASSIENWIYTHVFFAQQFTESMGCQVYIDITCGISSVLLVGKAFAANLLRKAVEMARILALPGQDSARSALYSAQLPAGILSVLDIVTFSELLTRTEAAKLESDVPDAEKSHLNIQLIQVLEALGVCNLTISEIKDVLRRRIDCPYYL